MSKIDTDQSGGVNDTELQGLLDKVAQKTGTQLSASDVLTQFDADGNGQLSSDELGKTMQSILPPPSTMDFAQQRASGSSSADGTAGTGEAGDDLFAKVDADGDNAISSTELQALLEAMSGGTASQTGVSSDDWPGWRTSSGSIAAVISCSPPLIATACSMAFSSWRMLPGHG